MFILGCLAFTLFFLGDLNDLRLHSGALIFAFPAGGVLLCVSTALQLRWSEAPVSGALERILLLAAFAVFAALLIYTLFFAFPADDAYGAPGKARRACTTGVYALCRHPGVLWLFFAMLCLVLAAGLPFYALLIYTALNLLLVVFEDRYVFPAILIGYDDYKSATPFLIPTRASISECLGG